MAQELIFGEKSYAPAVRLLSEMSDVVYDRAWLDSICEKELYYMYRGLSMNESDNARLKESSLRYDVTLIPPGNLGCEYMKTAGHYHPYVGDGPLSYTEVYEVISGTADYLMQKLQGDIVVDVILFRAKSKDKIVIPPGYGHITINPSDEPLKMANLVSSRFSSEYDKIKEQRGGAYFELVGGDFVENKNYAQLPELRILEPKSLDRFGISSDKSLYSFVDNLEVFSFLNSPADYRDIFEYSLQ